MAIKLGNETPPSLKVTQKTVSALIEYENNPRKNDKAVPEMVALIQKFGFRQPILVRGDEVVDGHLRLKAARKIGMKKIPAIDVGDMPDADVRALRIAMNKSAEFAEWDNAALAIEFQKLQETEFELAFTGFETGVIEKIMKEAAGETSPPKTKQADAGTGADPSYVSLTFHMTDASRKDVMARLDAVAEAHGLPNRSQALIQLCKD
jgi:ParB-like chromosome segregation protein Spo0J